MIQMLKELIFAGRKEKCIDEIVIVIVSFRVDRSLGWKWMETEILTAACASVVNTSRLCASGSVLQYCGYSCGRFFRMLL